MTERVERRNASHFDEAMAFLNEVFAVHGEHDFARMLPGIYQPDDEHMRHNLALRRDGRLLSIVGVFPITLSVQGECLRVAGVGGVSVARDEQGRGLFQRMMQLARDGIVSDGYQLSYLSGRRQRYRHFGWELTGTSLRYRIEAKHLAHGGSGSPPPELSLEPLAGEPDAALVSELIALHDKQPIHVRRRPERFARLLRSWRHEPLLARDALGRIQGYASGSSERRLIAELVAASPEHAMALVRALGARWGGTIELVQSALPSILNDELGRSAGRFELRDSGNWQIWDFAAVVGALLRARHAARALPEGGVLVKATEGVESYALWVQGEQAGCDRVEARADLEAPRDELLRTLLGPLPPALVAPLPPAAALLAAWCPLPLALALEDQV